MGTTNVHEDDIPEVREESFRYSGPLPQTKESAIISLADAVESASRSLEKPFAQRIEELVNDLVDDRVADHQLDECELTFHELREVVESFCFTLNSMLHRRIAYPKRPATVPPEHAAGRNGDGEDREREKVRVILPAPAYGGGAGVRVSAASAELPTLFASTTASGRCRWTSRSRNRATTPALRSRFVKRNAGGSLARVASICRRWRSRSFRTG